jgi:hypothetical protein
LEFMNFRVKVFIALIVLEIRGGFQKSTHPFNLIDTMDKVNLS